MEPYNVTWQQGDDLTFDLVYREGPVGEEVPVNLTGYEVRMDIVHGGERIYTFNSAAITPDADPIEVGDQPDDEVDATVGSDGSIKFHVPRQLTLPAGQNPVTPAGKIYEKMVAVPPVLLFNYDVFLRNESGTPGAIPVGSQRKILRGTIAIEKSYTLWL